MSTQRTEDAEGLIDPETEEYIAFLNKLYHVEFDEALYDLVNEAVALALLAAQNALIV